MYLESKVKQWRTFINKNIHLCYLIRKYHKSRHSMNFSETHSSYYKQLSYKYKSQEFKQQLVPPSKDDSASSKLTYLNYFKIPFLIVQMHSELVPTGRSSSHLRNSNDNYKPLQRNSFTPLFLDVAHNELFQYICHSIALIMAPWPWPIASHLPSLSVTPRPQQNRGKK